MASADICMACGGFKSHTSDCQRIKEFDPDVDLGPVDMAAIEFHGVYDSNVRAGFTPPQALYLLAVQMTGNPGIAPGLDLPEPPV